MKENYWKGFEESILNHLSDEDDPELWEAAINKIYQDAEILCNYNPFRKWIKTEIGCCKHWRRPHQTRWKADGGFAWPTGYAGSKYSSMGFPQRIWFERLYWHFQDGNWHPQDLRRRYFDHQIVRFDVVLPHRTTRHKQAAIYTRWEPGTPPLPKTQLIQFYGFRKKNDKWKCTAVSGSDKPYNLAVENSQ